MAEIRPFAPSKDRTPRYTVKEVSELTGLSAYTIRYYENSRLIPSVDRTDGNIRMFSEYALSWLRLVHCLRATGLPIDQVRHYIRMCEQGDSTIPERAEMIFRQEESLRRQLESLQQQFEVLKYKKEYYKRLLEGRGQDSCNPAARQKAEPDIVPELAL